MNILSLSAIRKLIHNEEDPGKITAFTGHRPKDLAGYKSREPYNKYVKYLQNDVLIPLIKKGYKYFITGGAQGIDQLAFWAIAGLQSAGYDIKNIVYVPFKGQELKWLEKGIFSQKEYRLMLELADAVVYLRNINADNFSETAGALTSRNHDMCDDADLLIATYLKSDFMHTKGGTAECLRYANKKGLETMFTSFDFKTA